MTNNQDQSDVELTHSIEIIPTIISPEGNYPNWAFENTDEHGAVDDQDISTYVRPLEKLVVMGGYLRVIGDDNGYNTEIRVPWNLIDFAMEISKELEGTPNDQ